MQQIPMLVNRLSRLIGNRRLSVSEVAVGSGVSRRALHELYHDKTKRIDLDTLNKLCAYLDVTPAEIFEYRRHGDDPAPHPNSASVIR